MTTLREAAQQALEALEWFNKYGSEEHGPSLRGAECSLRAALAEPVQEPEKEPVVWRYRFKDDPNGWMLTDSDPITVHSNIVVEPLYTHPPRREWRGLTTAEIDAISDRVERSDFFDAVIPFARAIEAALKEKNA